MMYKNVKLVKIFFTCSLGLEKTDISRYEMDTKVKKITFKEDSELRK